MDPMTEIAIDVSVKVRLEETEATGEPCACCREVPYLWPRRLICRASVDRGPFRSVEVYVCKDCADELRKFIPPHAIA
jgi:hypothetical protein